METAQRYGNPIAPYQHVLIYPLREANRCVKILENLSLRGVFWPSTCAAAIKDLQQALSRKTGTQTSGAQLGNSKIIRPESSRSDLTTRSPMNFQSPQENLTSLPLNSTAHSSKTGNQPWKVLPEPQGNILPDGVPNSYTERNDLFQTNYPSTAQNDPLFFDNWSGMNWQFHPTDDNFNNFTNFDDIFQLMDVPFHLNEQTFEHDGTANV